MRKLSKILVLVLALAMMFALASMFTVSAAQPEYLYLTPSANWKQSNARFAAYFFGNGEKWVSMTDSNGDGVYEVKVPTDKVYPSVIFCRMNPSASANNWNNKWNQTADLTIPTSGANHYTVKEGTWDKGGGTWSTFGSTCAHANLGPAATCTTAQECKDCGDPVVSALGHTYNSAHLCTRCNEQASFTVAGSGAHLGTEWDTGNRANDMTYANGVYTKVYTNVAAGSYLLKVARDHDWGTAYPSSDKAYTVAKAGSTVTVTLKGTTVTITVEAPHTHAFSDATCTEAPKCSCGETQGEALGHNFVAGDVVAPTFEAQGYTVYGCTRCDATENRDFVAPLVAVATANGNPYATLAEAFENGSEIVLLADVKLDAPLVLTGSYTLDLNGFTLSYDSTVQGEAMITNKGSLIINDSVGTGVINYNYTGAADSSYGKGNYTISNAGTLTVNGGKITIANLRGHAKYPIDNNSTTGDAILVINGGHLYNYNTSAIRMFCNSTTNKNSVTINGGLIEGYCAIWMQNPGKNTVNGELTIAGGEIRTTAAAWVNGTSELKDVSSAIYCTIAGEGGAWDEASFVTISGGTINENVYLADSAPASLTIGEAIFNGYVEVPHTHAFSDATCTEPSKCSCGETQGEALGHDFVKGVCSRCEAVDPDYVPIITGTGTEEDPFVIGSLEALIAFRDSVNAGETTYNAEGVYVALGADIDMAEVDWSVNIGDDCNATFDGIFDGKGHKILNLNAKETAQKGDGYVCAGLFGAIYGNAVIKNLTIENVSINTGDFTGNNVAAVVGFVYAGKGSIENVTVCGKIEINAPGIYGVGAIIGYSYSSNITVTGCKVEGAEGSYINAVSGAGAIAGYSDGVHVVNAEVSGLAIEAKGLIGGIFGIALGSDVNGATVSNVAINATKAEWVNGTGIAVGTIASKSIVVVGVTSENVTGADTLVGSKYAEQPATVVPAIEARIGDVYYASLVEALKAANGGTVVVLRDIALDATIVLDGASVNATLDLNGHTINAAFDAEVVEVLLVKNGATLTITGNGTMLATGDGEHVEVISVIDGGKLTIENGTFVSNGCTAIYATRGGHITINGGLYEAKELYNGMDFTLDINEAEEVLGTIVVNGGSFVRFNPANHNNDGANSNKLADGLHAIALDGVYTVAAHVWSDATCTAPQTCVCGATQGASLGHTWVDATCTAPKTCSVCGTTEGDALGHVDVDPCDHECDVCGLCITDCVDANNNHKCDVCGDVMSRCMDNDQNHFCDICGVQNSHCIDIPPYDHNCDWCGEKMSEHNYVEGVCDICGAEDPNYVPPHTHTWSNATCTEPAKCECGETQGEALGHNYVNGTCDVCNTKVIYFVNVEKWTKVNAYMWDSTNNGWPGVAMTKTGEQVHGFDVYKVEYTAAYVNVIFNNGSAQTADLVISKGHYFCPLNSIWYESASDVPSFEGITKTSYYLPGAFNSWKDANVFLKEGTSTVIRSYVSLQANQTYEFKVKTGNTWYGSTGTVSATSTTITFSTTGTNAKIKTACAGVYIFEYNTSTKKLTVIYPHVEETLEAVAPTCTTTGLTEGKKCSVCGTEYVKQTVVAALGHDTIVDAAAVAPTCTATGLTAGEHCSRCDYKVEQEVVPALGHTAGAEATCTTAQTCTVCGAELVAALGHTYENCACTVCEAVLPALELTDAFDFTTADGLAAALASGKLGYTGTFRNNGDSHQFAADTSIQFVVPANTTVTLTGHSTGYGVFDVYVNGVKYDMAGSLTFTVTEESKVVIVPDEEATNSKAYLKGISIAEYIDRTISTDTTITFGSEGNYKDSIVDFSGIQIGDNGGSNSQVKNGSFELLLKAGSKVVIHGYPGYTSYQLNGGDEITVEYYTYIALEDTVLTVTPVSGNNYFYSIEVTLHTGLRLVEAKDATCTEAGYNAYYACDCHGELTDKGEIAALGHDYEASVTAPTCTEAGYTTYTCACGDTYTADEVAALGHTFVYGKCTVCGEVDPDYVPYVNTLVVGDTNKIVVDGDTFNDYNLPIEWVAFIADEKATYTFVGDNSALVFIFDAELNLLCGGTGTATLEAGAYLICIGNGMVGEINVAVTKTALPHEHAYEAVVTAPTCTEAGYTTYTCACGDTYVADEVPALDHTYVDGKCECGAEDPNWVAPSDPTDPVDPVDPEEPAEDEEKDIFTKIWEAIVNFFASIVDFFKNLF